MTRNPRHGAGSRYPALERGSGREAIQSEHDDDELDAHGGALFDRVQIRNYIKFARGSLRRHWRLSAGVLAAVIALAAATLAILPRSYHAETKVLAQRSQVLAIRGDGPDADVSPTYGAAEIVLRRDNLLAIIETTELVDHYHEHRSVAQQLRDQIMGWIGPKGTEQDAIDGMVDRLEKKLKVWSVDSTVSISLEWYEPHMARRIVDIAQKNFLETRHAQEITAIVESIGIVQGHVKNSQKAIDSAVEVLENLHAQQNPVVDSPAVNGEPRTRVVRTTAAAAGPSTASLALGRAIETKKQRIDELEQARRSQLAEARGRLVEQQATLTDNHPTVRQLQQATRALATPSQQVVALRGELKELQGERAAESQAGPGPRVTTRTVRTAGGTSMAAPLTNEILRLDQSLREDRDPITVYARGQLRDAMEKQSNLLGQVRTAEIELDTAQAAFKYRYRVLSPAQLPKRPIKPNVPLILALALFAGGTLGLVVAIVSDLRKGRLVERWQIEVLLGRPILGEFEDPRLSERSF